eukprot:GHVH01012914.1.p1 GENE.GHVH01012914.1~~GHVH01012914.1.p1  ORF type:complete len:101 (+),score=6.25 GHVH01012914.1:58-360(+)
MLLSLLYLICVNWKFGNQLRNLLFRSEHWFLRLFNQSTDEHFAETDLSSPGVAGQNLLAIFVRLITIAIIFGVMINCRKSEAASSTSVSGGMVYDTELKR